MGHTGATARVKVSHQELPLEQKAAYVGALYAVAATSAFFGWLVMKVILPKHQFELGKLTLVAGGLGGLVGIGLAMGRGVLY